MRACRHGKFWMIPVEFGDLLWCYKCGAIRRISGNKIISRWLKPTGLKGINPYITWNKSLREYQYKVK